MEVPNMQGFSKSQITQLISDIPLGRGGRFDEVAKTLVWLAGDEATFINGTDLLSESVLRARAEGAVDGGRAA
jgi:NAD(P)-dependent dehydrogenase (short-subunit alcohol dehydrogenase family)